MNTTATAPVQFGSDENQEVPIRYSERATRQVTNVEQAKLAKYLIPAALLLTNTAAVWLNADLLDKYLDKLTSSITTGGSIFSRSSAVVEISLPVSEVFLDHTYAGHFIGKLRRPVKLKLPPELV